jgi:hypothetical protein
MGDRVEIGMPDEAPPGIVPERGGAGRMKPDRRIEPLELVPQRLARLVVAEYSREPMFEAVQPSGQ